MTTTFSSPLPLGCRFTSGFGKRWGTLHAGTDYAPPEPGQAGIPVFAVADGPILTRGYGTGAANDVIPYHSGRYIWQDIGTHGRDRMRIYYGHLASYSVQPGQYVRAGQQIGVMGGSGKNGEDHFAIHLHLGVAQNHARPVQAAARAGAPGWINADAWLRSKGITVGTTAPAGAITHASTPPASTPKKEDTLSTEEVAELKTYFLTHLRTELNAAEARIKKEVGEAIVAAERRTKAHTDNSAVSVEARTTGRIAGVQEVAAQAAEAAGREPDWKKAAEVAEAATSKALGEAASAGFDLTLNVTPKEGS